MSNIRTVVLAVVCLWTTAVAQSSPSFDPAAAFGARPGVSRLRLSPDGQNVAFIVPGPGQGSVVYALSVAKGSQPKAPLSADGKPFRLRECNWVANDRLVCEIYFVGKAEDGSNRGETRLVAVDSDGKNLKVLSTRENFYSRGWQFYGGEIIDWLPDESGAVLMTRNYLPDDHIGSHIGSDAQGLAVDWIDTRTLTLRHVEPVRRDAVLYLSDGRGTVRIVGTDNSRANLRTGTYTFYYRVPGSRDWRKLSDYNEQEGTGLFPKAVDHDLNVAYGYKKKDGRWALYSVALDGSLREQVVYARSDVDVDNVVRIGRRNRVVGTAYATDISRANYFAPDIEGIVRSLTKALPEHLVDIVDTSADESRMVVHSSSDVDAGVYYLFDRKTHQLQTFLVSRSELEGSKLAHVKPITYPAADGTPIPAYLTLPVGHEDAKGLPAIVMPHGGPAARDQWGFDWLAQFFAARGYAVLQPNFRGSAGYGDAWEMKNGFKSWPVAIADVLDGGRWLVREGIADPSKLAIVGWSYGGYAALQSAVIDPTVFKAVVAIAPVTDLSALKEQERGWANFAIVSEYVGDGKAIHEGSPAEHADRIKVPVLLFHGGRDANVSVAQSKEMAARLKAAGDRCELVTWDDLDHQLEDSAARTQLLRQSDAFLRQALGM
ncbi:MAG TPA: S9 family peptidase [Steroidobacteraceae bacterium]|jgi:dipeptidyl aminopeptidase/acylaminoacyl peptidase